MITNSQLSDAYQFDAFVNDQNIIFVRQENPDSSNNTKMDQPVQTEHGKRSKTIDFSPDEQTLFKVVHGVSTPRPPESEACLAGA